VNPNSDFKEQAEIPVRRSLPMTAKILIAMSLGAVLGPLLGPSATYVGSLGVIVIQLIKAVATPLVFLVIVRAVATSNVRGGAFLRVLGVATINVSAALTIGLSLSNLVRPGDRLSLLHVGHSDAFVNQRFDWAATLRSFFPQNIVTPFAENAIFSVVILALLFGFALRVLGGEGPEAFTKSRSILDLISGLYRIIEIILGWILHLIPFAVFAVVTKTVGEHGFGPLRGLTLYVLVGLSGLAIHSLLIFQLWVALYARIPLRRFWTEAREPMAVAFGSNSSLATLPVTLRALDRLGVSRSSSAVGACVATNLNNDGIVLYEGMAALLVAQAAGIDLSLAQQLLVALFSVVAAMGVAGVPEAGFISLALVLNAANLPLELLPLLLTVDWIVARGRSVVNVLSDMVLSIVLDKSVQTRVPKGSP
jgi:Na+/H+-dicarboxylate symporter